MHVERGDAWIELGLRAPNWPEITIRYDHEFRFGQKDSTVWGDTNLTGLLPPYNSTRKIVPSFRNIDEKRDIFSFEASKTIGNTDVLLGMRYEHNTNDYSLNMERGAGQLPPAVPPPGQQRKVTQQQNDDVDLFSGHGITETRITDNHWFTAGYSYTTITNDLSGSRIFGTHWEEEYGQVDEFQSFDEEIPLDKNTNALGQKYSIGATWYPTMRLNFAGQYFHRIASYDEDIFSAQFPRLINQDWNVDDFNIRMTFRPKLPACMGTLALATRYDFVHTSIDSQWAIFPQEDLLAELQSGEIKKHVISESLNWNPLPRFFLQANFSYVLNQTDTPANDINLDPQTSPTVVNFRNDYWTVTSGIGYIIDDKTTFYADYYFYCANDYFKNPVVAVPYGMGATEHAVSATVTRKISKNMRLLLKYGYFNYRDVTSGGHNNYQAHSLFSSLQVRF